MKTRSLRVLSVLLLSLALLPLSASADWHGGGHRDFHGWHHGHWSHGWHDGSLGWWWVVGGLWYFYPRPVYPYPASTVVVVPQTPPAPVAAVPPPTQYWYYCEAAKAYYPYVASCPGGWRKVPAVPAGASGR